MRYRTATVLSVVLVGGMLLLPVVVKAVLERYAESGQIIPLYLRILFGLTAFCMQYGFLLVLPIVAILFIVAAVTQGRTPARP